MKTIELQAIQELISRAEAAFDRGNHAEAREQLLSARALAAEAGLSSGFLVWRLCVVSDLLNDWRTAMKLAKEAILLDPLALPFRRSLRIVLDKLRQQLLDVAARANAADELEPLYEALILEGAADDKVHVALAGHLLRKGDAAGALRLTNAVTLLSPACSEAWRVKAQACRALGDEPAAREAEARAQAQQLDAEELLLPVARA